MLSLNFSNITLAAQHATQQEAPNCSVCKHALPSESFNQICDHYWSALRLCGQKNASSRNASMKLCDDQKSFEFCSGLRNQCSGDLRLFMDLELKSSQDIDEYFYCYSLNTGKKNETEGEDFKKYRDKLKPLIKTAAKGFQLDSRLFSCLLFRESGNWREKNLPQFTGDAQREVNQILGDPQGKVLLIRELHKEWEAFLKEHPHAKVPGKKLDSSEFEQNEVALNSSALYLRFITQTLKRSLCQRSISVRNSKTIALAYDQCMLESLSPQYELLAFATYNWGIGTLDEVLKNTRHDLKSILKYLEKNPKKETPERRLEMRNHLISLLNCSLRDRWQPQPGSKKTDFKCHEEWGVDSNAKPDEGLN